MIAPVRYLLAKCCRFPRFRGIVAISLSLPLVLPLSAQTTSTNSSPEDEDEFIEISPFVVTTSSESGYLSRASTAGTRFNADLRDMGSQISVMTPEFLDDIGAATLEEAQLYSLNVENLTEFTSPSGESGTYGSGIQDPASNVTRVRGLTSAARSHDFFVTRIALDRYNTERFTLASGPNSIMFGLGSAAGLGDGSYKRARLGGELFGEVGLRVDNEGSVRVTTDINVPLVDDRVSFRLAAMRDRANSWREPARNIAERIFLTGTAQLTASTQLRAWYEDIHYDRNPTRPMIVYDAVSPWLNGNNHALFDNSGITPTTRGDLDARIAAYNALAGADVISRWGNNDKHVSIGPENGREPYLHSFRNTVATRIPDFADTKVQQRVTLQDPRFPRNVSVWGNGTQTIEDASIKGLTLEQRLGKKWFVELGYNREDRLVEGVDMIRGNQVHLYADINMYLPDGITPNPNAGRFYMVGIGRGTRYKTERESMRATLAGSFDFTERSKWLGRHQIGAMVAREEYKESDGQQNFDLRVLNESTDTPLISDGNTIETRFRNNDRRVRPRAYIGDFTTDDPSGVYWINFPWEPLDNYTFADGTTIGTVRNGIGGTSSGGVEKFQNDSGLVVLQSRWWNDRVVTTAGLRRDRLRSTGFENPMDGPGPQSPFLFVEDVWDDFGDWEEDVTGNTRTLGVVVYPAKWLSLYFNDSDTVGVDSPGIDPYGNIQPGQHGTGQDMGITLAPFGNDKFYLKLNRYDATAGPTGAGIFQSQIRGSVRVLELTAIREGLGAHSTYQPEGSDIGYAMTANRASEGWEIEAIANPTRNWRLSFSLIESESTLSDISRAWADFAHERSPVWAQIPDAILEEHTEDTVFTEFANMSRYLNLMDQTDGSSIELTRGTRANFVTNYRFTEGLLKNISVGGALRWRGKSVVGYLDREVPNNYPFPGLGDTVEVLDQSKPVYGDSTLDVDCWVGYSRKILRDKVDWRIQLNVRNLLDRDDINIHTIFPDTGLPARYGYPTPRSFTLTNTFRF